jgi:hypothetical protein
MLSTPSDQCHRRGQASLRFMEYATGGGHRAARSFPCKIEDHVPRNYPQIGCDCITGRTVQRD